MLADYKFVFDFIAVLLIFKQEEDFALDMGMNGALAQ